MIGGRDIIPGESDAFNGSRDHARYLSRVISGQIVDVNEDGRVKVATIKELATIPITITPMWFSSTPVNPNDPNSPARTAWGRYMPMGNEAVEIGYRNDDTPYIYGYNITATDEEERAGYPVLTKFQETNVLGYAGFRKLRGGEFDFKSVGDAYIHGSAFGVLFLAGGQSFIRLDKQAYRIESKSSEFHFTSDTSELRIGTVFRKKLLTDAKESAISSISGGLFKEVLIDVNTSIVGFSAPQSKFKLHAGDILTSLLQPENSSSGQPLRFRMSIGDTTDLIEAFKLEIDAGGNIVWDQSILGTDGLTMNMNKLTINTNTSILLEAVTQADYNAPLVTIGASAQCNIKSPLISLGGTSAIHPLLLSNLYRVNEATMNNVILTNITVAAAAIAAAAGDPVLAAIAPVAASSLATAGAALALIPPAISIFEGSASLYLSTNTFTA